MPEQPPPSPSKPPKAPEPRPSSAAGPRTPGASQAPTKPWRTEGLPPEGQPPKRRWLRFALGLLVYLVFFSVLTVQDWIEGPDAVPYTEFKKQVSAQNVVEVFARGDSIQGGLRQPATLPGQPAGQPPRTYQKFTTERPTFANDDLLGELTAGGAGVRATPLVQQRGIFANLLISVAPFALMIAFYAWMFKRQQGAMGGGILGGRTRKPVDPESVRVTFADVAGIDEVEAEINEIVDFLRDPEKYRKVGARAPKGVLLSG